MDRRHLTDGTHRDFISLSLEEVERLARGELRLVGQGASYQATFESPPARCKPSGRCESLICTRP